MAIQKCIFRFFTPLILLLVGCGDSSPAFDPRSFAFKDESPQVYALVAQCRSSYESSVSLKQETCQNAAEVLADSGLYRECEEEKLRLEKAFSFFIQEQMAEAQHWRRLCLVSLAGSKRSAQATHYEFCDSEIESLLKSKLNPCDFDQIGLRHPTLQWKVSF